MKEDKDPTPHFLMGKDGKVQVFPGPVTQEKAQGDPKTFQAMAVKAYQDGDNASRRLVRQQG